MLFRSSVRRWYGGEELELLKNCCDWLIRSPCYMDPEETAAVMRTSFPESGLIVLTVNDPQGEREEKL